ncbi:flagellar FlbD family protein [Planococcus shixiaomingii]|uniref:flagellar FlbD family protein n=1 Tax=Planococcus shixiaomingii TaxID=3058393 RepID=UPI00261B6CD8|nr:flagellar FlbD family protein [Planococcus sp. N022]WKA53907.1 flagellar FlbD family protein [Planococcus sp. N022]
MIQLTMLNQTKISLNAVYIERLDATPDTIVTMISGKKVYVLETVEEVAEKVTSYYREINVLSSLHRPNLEE